MKSIILIVALFSTAAFACPGGHLKSLAVKKRGKDVEWAQVDIVSSTVTAGKNASIVEILWQSANAETMEVVCGMSADGDKGCGKDVGLGYKLLENPTGILMVAVQVGKSTKRFKVTNFRQTRSVGSCGATVYPETK